MLNFVDITKEVPFQNKDAIPFLTYGLQHALKSRPLDFFYSSAVAVTSFAAKKVNSLGVVVETVNLSTSLVVADGSMHMCAGLVDYASDLSNGIYYFEINGQYWSDYFLVNDTMVDGTSGQGRIDVSGLNFINTDYNISWRKKIGSPDILYGLPVFDNRMPPAFRYLASDDVSSFKFVTITPLGIIGEEINISTSLITSDGTYHTCNGSSLYPSSYMSPSIGYFEVNLKYESDIVQLAKVENRGIGYDIIGSTLIVY